MKILNIFVISSQYNGKLKYKIAEANLFPSIRKKTHFDVLLNTYAQLEKSVHYLVVIVTDSDARLARVGCCNKFSLMFEFKFCKTDSSLITILRSANPHHKIFFCLF